MQMSVSQLSGAAVLAGFVLSAGFVTAQDRRIQAGISQAGSAIASGAGRYQLLVQGAVAEADAASMLRRIEEARPTTAEQADAALQGLKIDGGMPNRISMNVTVPKQTQGATFGERVNAGRKGRAVTVILARTEQDEQEARALLEKLGDEAGGQPGASNIRPLRAPSGKSWTLATGAQR
jgi:hypothetical protein